jgi:PRC-barrel domain protein
LLIFLCIGELQIGGFVDHPLPWLRYVDADDLEDDTIDFDGMNVQSPTGEHLGDVDGFIVDSNSGRPYYVVVDSRGWFRTKHFLIPVGHLRFNSSDEAMVADISRDRIDAFPGFDKDEFEKMSADDLKRLNDDICQVCNVEGVAVVYAADEPLSAAWDRPHYGYPDWWHAEPTLPERMGEKAFSNMVETSSTVPPATNLKPAPDVPESERVRMHDVDPAVAGAKSADRDLGRAQPGDVIGIETSETTTLGDTAEDEDKRRRAAEDADLKRKP